MNIVLDTNCLVIAISRQSEYHQVWQDFLAGKLIIKDHTMTALGLGGKPYKKIKVTHLMYFPEKGCHLGTNRSDNET